MKKQEIDWLLHEKYNGEKTEGFFADCTKLEAGIPLAYLIGHIPFLGTTIHLDSHPLIPRPETEHWTERAIAEIRQTPTPHIIDLCAGSGAIGVAIATHIPASSVTFGEIDPAHLPTIAKNLSINRKVSAPSTQFNIIESDLFKNITGTFDFILTNPPYIDKAANTVEDSVHMHEPHLALFGGKAGLELITEIITTAPNHLNPHGQLWIEHEPFQSDAITTLAKANDFSCKTYTDQYNTERYSVLTRSVSQ